MDRFRDRRDAGRQLAHRLRQYARSDAIVLGLARGGVPVAFEVAEALELPLDVLVVRKVGAPGREELAMGAVAQGGVRVINHEVVDAMAIAERLVEEHAEQKQKEVDERARLIRGDRPLPDVRDRTVILVDNGVATGATIIAAAKALKLMGPRKLVLAAPVLSPSVLGRLQEVSDDVAYVLCPERLQAVGHWYHDFSQTTDEEVLELLGAARKKSQEVSR